MQFLWVICVLFFLANAVHARRLWRSSILLWYNERSGPTWQLAKAIALNYAKWSTAVNNREPKSTKNPQDTKAQHHNKQADKTTVLRCKCKWNKGETLRPHSSLICSWPGNSSIVVESQHEYSEVARSKLAFQCRTWPIHSAFSSILTSLTSGSCFLRDVPFLVRQTCTLRTPGVLRVASVC